MKKVILSFAVLAFTLTACNDKKQDTSIPATEEHAGHEGHEEHTANEKTESVTTVKKSDVLQSTLDAYFSVKKALQEDKAAEASTAGKTLATNLKAVVTED
ncbi:MAG: DUF3347 domain-containing protein, partial [Flavobacterium sp.]